MNLHSVIFTALAVLCAAGLNGAENKVAENKPSGTKLLDAYNKIDAGLVIANAAGESGIIQQIAMAASKSDPKLIVTVEKLSREDAIKSFAAGKAGLLLLPRELSPQEKHALSGAVMIPYAAEPTLIAVNSVNDLPVIKTEMLKRIFSGEVASWKPLGVSDYMIHLFGTEKNSPGTGPLSDKILNGVKLTSKIFSVTSSTEVLQLVSTNNHALGFCGFVDPVPDTVKILKVDGIDPTEKNILTGKYPLVNTYCACYKGGNEVAQLFVKILRSPSIGAMLKERGLIPITEK